MAGESVIMDFLRSQEEKQNQNGQQEKQIVYIDIEDLEASKENFYGLRDLEALKASISLHGLLQPVLVIPAKIEGKYTVLGGGRRRQAIEELVDEGKEELRKVPCIISDGKIQGEDTEEEPDEVQELIGKLNIISANSFREKTDWEKMEETLQIGSIIKELKKLGKLKGNVREMQVELSGIKGTQIARYNAIMNHLSLELMQAFKNNDFGISVAYELSRLSDDHQQQAWEMFLENKILTLSDTEKLHNLQKTEEENLEGQMEIQEFLEEETSTDNRQESAQDISTITEEELEEEPGEAIPEEIQEKEQQKEKTILKKPSEQEREYLKLLAKHLIKSMYSWFLEDYTNRVLMVSKSPEEIKRKVGINHRTWYFSTEKGAAHANLFDDYVQLWDEKSNYIGDYDWFCLAAAIQSMWNKVALEKVTKTATEPEKIIVEVVPGIEAEITDIKKATKAAKIEEKKAEIEAISDISIAPAQQHEENKEQQEVKEELQTEAVKIEQQTEKYEQTTEQADIELLKEELKKAQRYLTMLSEEFTEKDIRVRKQKLVVGALAGMIAELDNEFPEPVQPPLPKLKNNEQRKEWLNNYRSWGIWYKDEHIGATYYRYQFGNGADLIVEEYENENEYTGRYTSSYFHLVGGPEPPRKNGMPKWNRNKKYNRYQNSETELIEFLKEIQR